MTDLSVVIPTVGPSTTLPATVDALADQGAEDIVIVLDGPPTNPNIVSTVDRHEQVRVISLDHNQGANMARAHGIEAAHGELILLLDDDIQPEPGFLDGHRQAHIGHRRRVIAGYIPVALPRHRSASDLAAYECATQYEISVRRWQSNSAEVLAGLWAGNVSARRELFAAIEFPQLSYFEDLNMGVQLSEAGGEGVFLEHVRGTHHYAKGLSSFWDESISRGRGAAQLERLHGDVPDGIVTNAHRPHGSRGAVIRLLAVLSAIPGARFVGLGVIAVPGWCRLWGLQAGLAGVVRLAVERRSFVRGRRWVTQ